MLDFELLRDARRLARQRFAAPRLSGTVRLGVVEEIAGGSLHLRRAADLLPSIRV